MVTVNDVLNAYMACEALSDKELPFKFSYNVALLKRKLEPVFESYLVAEKKCIDRYATKDENGRALETAPGTFTFDNAADKEEYLKEVAELRECEAGLTNLEKRKTVAPDSIPPSVLMALMVFLDFEEGE